jgi:hypothetical protein
MAKLSEMLDALAQSKDHHRVWTELRNYLRRFTDDEISKREKIKKDNGTEVGVAAIQAIIDEITNEKLRPLQEHIDGIGDLEVTSDSKVKKTKKKAASTSQSAKESDAKESGNGSKKVSERAGGKARSTQGSRRIRRTKNPGASRSGKQGAQ